MFWIFAVLSDFDHFEVFFAYAAFGAHPVIGYIIPTGACGNAIFR
jgi:hypothetical protein